MTSPSVDELRRLRLQPHRSEVHLSIYVPPIIFACQVNGSSVGKGSLVIPYDNVTQGAFIDVLAGMTILIGASAGSKDQGRLRVRSIDASEINVAENDDIDWRDDLHLTVIGFFEPWSVFPRITLDADNLPTFYKDYDILYVDQNTDLDPIINMGPNHAVFIPNAGSAEVYYSASGSQDLSVGGGLSAYDWFFEGGTPTGSTNAEPGNVQYTAGGHYTTRLTVTSTLGKTFTSYRHVSIYDKAPNGPNVPIQNWGIRDFNGARSDNGWRVSFWVKQNQDFSDIVDGALVVLFSEDWYGEEKGSLGGNAANRSSILFSGYIDGETIQYDALTSTLGFVATSITRAMAKKQTFGTSLEDGLTASTWTQMANMTVDRAALHFLRWHSTVLSVADFSPTGNTLPVQFIDFDRTNLLSAFTSLYRDTLEANFVSDRQGKIYAEIDVSLRTSGSRGGYEVNMEPDRRDWIGSVSFPRTVDDDLAFIEVGGVAYPGPVSGTFTAHLAQAPGVAPSYTGAFKRTTGKVIASQADLNGLTGRMWAEENQQYPNISISLAGNYRNFDIVPQSIVPLTLDEPDTFRKIVWRSKHFIISSQTISIAHENSSITMDLDLSEETWGGLFADTIDIPVIPPFDYPDLPDFDLDIPPIIPPPITPPPIDGFDPDNKGGTVYVFYAGALARTRNFWDISPNWENLTPGLDLQTPVEGDMRSFKLFHGDPQNSALLISRPFEAYLCTNLDSSPPTWTVDLSHANAKILDPDLDTGNHVVFNCFQNWGAGSFMCLVKPEGIIPPPFHADIFYRHLGVWSLHKDAGVSQASQRQSISADPYAGLGGTIMYIYDTPDELRASFNGGLSYEGVPDPPDAPLVMQILGIGGDAFLYTETDSLGTEKRLYYTADGGETKLNYSPAYNGSFYGVTSHANPEHGRGVYFHAQSGQLFAALQPWAGTQTAIFYSPGPPAPWSIRHVFIGYVPLLTVNPANPDLLYAHGNPSDGRILGSQDGGVTWYDKTGDFESAVKSFAAAGAAQEIMPVWTVD